MKTSLSLLSLACMSALSSAPSLADTDLVGKLTNTNKTQVLPGAKITLKELNRSAVTKRDGTFRFNQIPAGTYTALIHYVGASPRAQDVTVVDQKVQNLDLVLGEETVIEDILVRGQRSGQANALNRQRSARKISSVVAADAIGQFPDQNAAESLQRLPGISIERDQGEGRFVGIRGIDPNLNNVTINGVNIPSPEGGVRAVALDVIPSELIQTLEVSKSVTPDMDADAIGGNIEVKSVSAFDYQEDTARVTVQMSQNQLRDETSPKISAVGTHQFNSSLGVAAAVSYFDRDFGSDNVESNGDDELEQRHYTINRERLGAAVNVDYRPDFNNQYYLRTLYSEFSDDEYRQRNTFTLDGEDSEIERSSKDRYETQTILSLSAGAEHHLDQWMLSYQLAYSKSEEDEPDALYYDFKTDNGSIASDINTRIPMVTQDAAAMDLTTYELDEIALENNFTQDTETSLRFDLSRPVAFGQHEGEIKFGSKYRSREKTRDSRVFIYDGDFDGIDPSAFGAATPEYRLGDFGPGLNRGALRNNFVNQRSSLELDALNSELESNGATYVNEEDIFAAYFMATAQIDKLTLVAGVRYEKTDFSTNGMRVELIEDEQNDVEDVVNTPWNNSRDYDYLLPSINLTYAFNDKLIGRAAYTQTIARPLFEQVAAFQIIESQTEENDDGGFDTEREAEVGNPNLEPYESDNFDLSLEYYPGNIGVMSAGLFYKDIDNFVIVADVAGTQGWEGFDEVFQPLNGESAQIRGVELAWVKTFDNGLLLSANGTFSSSDAVSLLDGERYETSLPNQSDRVGNLTVGYENNKVNLRLTMTHKSNNLEEIDGDLIKYEDEHQQLDFSGKYYLNNDMTLYFNAINLSDEPFYSYFDQQNRNAQYEEYGRTFELGFTWQL